MTVRAVARVVMVHGTAGALLETTLRLLGLEPIVKIGDVTVWALAAGTGHHCARTRHGSTTLGCHAGAPGSGPGRRTGDDRPGGRPTRS